MSILAHRSKVEGVLDGLRRQFGEHELNEQAVPSYLSANRLLKATFWRRLKLSSRALRGDSFETVLDFGCGLGALFPELSSRATTIYAFEKFPAVLAGAKAAAERLELKNIIFLDPQSGLNEIADGSLDAIMALDVLEHVDDLDSVLLTFRKKLKASGSLVVCSPTEYWYYRLARKFGGKGYQGEFHERAADDVEADLRKYFRVQVAARIYPIFTFFRIVRCTQIS